MVDNNDRDTVDMWSYRVQVDNLSEETANEIAGWIMSRFYLDEVYVIPLNKESDCE